MCKFSNNRIDNVTLLFSSNITSLSLDSPSSDCTTAPEGSSILHPISPVVKADDDIIVIVVVVVMNRKDYVVVLRDRIEFNVMTEM